MQTLSQFSAFLQRSNLGPAALLVAAILTTYLIARKPRVPVQPRPVIPLKSRITAGVVRWGIIGVAGIGVLLAMGIDLHGLWSMLGAVLSLVAIGFVAMWSILSHMLASLLIVAFRPFEIDDQIELVGDDPIHGKVIDLNLVYTTLRTADGDTLRIPNNLFFQKVSKRHAPQKIASEHPSLA